MQKDVTVLMSAWIPAPPPESEPAMIRTRPHRRPASRRGGTNDAADVVDDRADQRLVFALGHHPDHRLGPGLADQQPTTVPQPPMAIVDGLLHALLLEGLAAIEADVAQHLQQRLEHPADLARPAAGAENDGQNLQSGDQAVARCRVVAEDDVPRLLAADV